MFKYVCWLMLLPLGLLGQAVDSLRFDTPLLQGYGAKVQGGEMRYHSPIPGLEQALLVRATNGRQMASWETEPVPAEMAGEEVTFVWLAGLGCNLGEARMDLSVNGLEGLSFWVDAQKNWTVNGPEGLVLSYRHIMFDGSRDQFGYMFLRVPAALLTPGQPLRLQVTGGRFNQQTWYMTFMGGLEAGLSVRAYPALLKGSPARQALAASVYHFGPPEQVRLRVNGRLLRETTLQFGHNLIEFDWPAVDKPTRLKLRLDRPGRREQQEVTLQPARHWEVYFVQHSHTDIGYTRPQTEILSEHLRYIDYALDYCDATDSLPEAAQFRWTCEASWAVDAYLRSRPAAQVARLKRRVEEGRIEVTGMYFNFDELPDEQTLAASLAPLRRFKAAGLPVQLAMQNDVNGTGWCFNEFFHTEGVRYLNMGTHGHRALICFEVPTAFWWESPAGHRMLAFRAEHYMTGNTVMGIHAGDFGYFEDKLLSYLSDLGAKGYPHDLIAIQHSGFLTDNSPPSTRSSEMIRRWNEKYQWPQLRSAVASEFFEAVEARHGAELPVYRVAWPDWWTDGFGSAAREVAATREAHTDMLAHQGLLSMAHLLGSPLPEGLQDRIAAANEAILFYGEHTLGSSESVRDPYGTRTMEQREVKESFAWEANRRAAMLGEEAMGLLQAHIEKDSLPSLVVFNTLSWARSGLVEVYIDHELLPAEQAFRIEDAAGQPIPAQRLESRSDGTYWALWVEDIPALGSCRYRLRVLADLRAAASPPDASPRTELENAWYRLRFDPARGALTELYDKDLAQSLLDPEAPWGLGELIHEHLGDRTQLEARVLNDFHRQGLDSLWFEGYEDGPIWETMRFRGETESFFSPHGFMLEFRLFRTTRRLDLVYEIVKKPIVEPEAIYLAFPFQLPGGEIYCEVPGGEMAAGRDQLPGSANDWNTLQNYVSVRGKGAQVLFTSQEAPLIQLGAINTGRYQTGASPATNHLYSWPMNNYWTTNFNADQRGGHRWTYALTSTADTGRVAATRFGWGARVPLPARVLPAAQAEASPVPPPVLAGIPDYVLLVGLYPGETDRSVILHLRELEGKAADLSGLGSPLHPEARIERVSATRGALPGEEGLSLEPLGSGFYRMAW
ncbi:MAG: glycosyl hydrolase family 38 [Bacteroidetes bacterium]|nr:MAG: glycosyl hydrolase family 38 [Bacteroidota bacterium]